MATNLAVDDELLAEAQEIGGFRTKKDTVNEALREYIQRRKQAKIIELFGTIDFDDNHLRERFVHAIAEGIEDSNAGRLSIHEDVVKQMRQRAKHRTRA